MVFDLDGVFRHWGENDLAEEERDAGLPPRTVLRTAFAPDLTHALCTGRLPYEDWITLVEQRLTAAHGPRVHEVLMWWRGHRGTLDPAMIRVGRRVRRRVTTALLSNGSTRLEEDLEVLKIDAEWDYVFNTARMGVAKPDPAAFRSVLEGLGLAPHEVAFIDDLRPNVTAAAGVGMVAHQHTSVAGSRSFLSGLGVYGPMATGVGAGGRPEGTLTPGPATGFSAEEARGATAT